MKKILIADDSFQIRKSTKDVLTKEGYLVKTASTTDEALELVNKWHPDLLLLDILIPGTDLKPLLRKLDQVNEVKILYISVIDKFMAEKKKLLDYSDKIKGHIHKPFSIDELLTKVELALSS